MDPWYRGQIVVALVLFRMVVSTRLVYIRFMAGNL